MENNLAVVNIDGMEAYEKDGVVYLKLETIARGLGFTQIARSGNEVIRWERINKYLSEFNVVPTSGDGNNSGENVTETSISQSGRNSCPEFIPENIFYRLAMKASNAAAVAFQEKVANEIIPQIRKNGYYSMTSQFPQMPQDYVSALRALADEVETRQKLEIENQEQKKLITEYEPKVGYYHEILESTDYLTVTQIAKDYGLSANRLNRILEEEKIQYKVNNQWVLYDNIVRKGYTKSETISITHRDGTKGSITYTKWSQKGRLMIHNILKNKGIRALIDVE